MPELEDDVAEIIENVAMDVTIDGSSTAAGKQQLRDALTKLIDARITLALSPR